MKHIYSWLMLIHSDFIKNYWSAVQAPPSYLKPILFAGVFMSISGATGQSNVCKKQKV